MQDQLICKNCGHHFTGKYCNNCGEKVYTEKDKSVLHFFEEGLHFITHFEGKFFTTIRTLVTKPGQLSVDYCNGKRKSYFKPLSLFLLLVVLYLLFPLYQGLNMQSQFHEKQLMYGHYARVRITHIMTERSLTAEQFEAIFHHQSEKIAKFLLPIIIPFTALFLWAVMHRKRKYLFDHMVFSAEINSIYVLWAFLLLPVLTTLYNRIAGPSGSLSDLTTGLMGYIPFCIYVAIGMRRFYSIKKWQSILQTLLFSVAYLFIIEVMYKFILFIITINLV